jgi:hypothetical protein
MGILQQVLPLILYKYRFYYLSKESAYSVELLHQFPTSISFPIQVVQSLPQERRGTKTENHI